MSDSNPYSFWTRKMLSGFIQSYDERHWVENYSRKTQKSGSLFLRIHLHFFYYILYPWYRAATFSSFNSSLLVSHLTIPANKQDCPTFWLPMDHPISASLTLIGFIHFNKMPALRFPMLNVSDPLSVLSFSYLNLTWLNAQRYTERQQSLRWFITQQKQTQPKEGEDNRTKDTRQQSEWRDFFHSAERLYSLASTMWLDCCTFSCHFSKRLSPFCSWCTRWFWKDIWLNDRYHGGVTTSPTYLHPHTTLGTHGTGFMQCWKQAVITNGSIIILINAVVDYNLPLSLITQSVSVYPPCLCPRPAIHSTR